MKRHLVDYRRLRPGTLFSPEYSHLLLILGWVGYFIMFFVTERFIPVSRCHVIHSKLDDLIPFREEFVLVYVFWYLYVFGTLLFFLLFDSGAFRRIQIFLITSQIIGVVTYIIYPSIQDLRPEVFPRENIFTRILSGIYGFDTPTGVMPSMHVAFSMAVAVTWAKDRYAPRWFKIFVIFAAMAIAASTTFVKQHSILDVFAAVPVGLVSEAVVRCFEAKRKRKTEQAVPKKEE